MTKKPLLHIGPMNTTLSKFIYFITKKTKYSNGVIN